MSKKSALHPLFNIALIASVFLAFHLVAIWQQDQWQDEVGIKLDSVRPAFPGSAFSRPKNTRFVELSDKDVATTVVDEAQIADWGLDGKSQHGMHSAGLTRNGTEFTVVAPGIDYEYHFANAYLVDYVPYRNVPAWVPIYSLALLKTYQFDDQQYGFMGKDIWQTSQESFYFPRGDCEDHAIALADWLIGLNLDARVVLGTIEGKGHAWVVVTKDNQTYLIEATDKNRQARAALPLATLHPEYHPSLMFNRETFWVNTGSQLTTDYRSGQWQIRSTYHHI